MVVINFDDFTGALKTNFQHQLKKRKRLPIMLSPFVLAACGGGSGYKGPNLEIINSAPTDVTLVRPDNVTPIPENTSGIDIGTLQTTDPDTNDSHAYHVSDSRFKVENGVLKLIAPLNYEEYYGKISVSVTARDQGGLQKTQSFEFEIADLNDAPTGVTLSHSKIIQNSNGVYIATIFSKDEDRVDQHSYTISDDRFEIINGQLKLKDGVNLTDDEGSQVDVTITTTDKEGVQFTETITLTVTAPEKLLEGYNIFGYFEGEQLGVNATTIGDINGDGLNDFMITGKSGQSYIVFGSKNQTISSLDISNLTPEMDFKIIRSQDIYREATGLPERSNYLGFSSKSGDFNGDGIDDILIADTGYEISGATKTGRTHIIFGKKDTPFPETIDLDNLSSTDGITITGKSGETSFGGSLSFVGDVNGDGFDDVLISDNGHYSVDGRFGNSFLIFGFEDGANSDLDMETATSKQAIRLFHSELSGYHQISPLGDINGDGLSDFMIHSGTSQGAPQEAYLVFGNENFEGDIDLKSLDGSNGLKVTHGDSYKGIWHDMYSVGDVNQDGFDDFTITAYDEGYNYTSFVLYGKEDGYADTINLSDLDPAEHFTLTTSDETFKNPILQTAGDINGDGITDYMVANSQADVSSTQEAGKVYILFGKAGGFTGDVNLDTLDGSNGFVINGEGYAYQLGTKVTAAGDLNGDGIDDLIIAAPWSYPIHDNEDASVQPSGGIQTNTIPPNPPNHDAPGMVFVIYGQTTPFEASYDASDIAVHDSPQDDTIMTTSTLAYDYF